MFTSRYSNKGYVFTLESALAMLLVIGFLGIAVIHSLERESFISLVQSEELINDLQRSLDENGLLLGVLDNNSFSTTQKMDSIYNQIRESIPENYGLRIKLERFDSNKEKCVSEGSFQECFEKEEIFPVKGGSIPENREKISKKFLLVKKEPVGECEILGEAELKAAERKNERIIAFFGGEKIFFQGEDLNIEFSTEITPEGEAECGENIRVDLNASVPSVGRDPADIMLLLDKSGSMDEKTANMGKISSGAFNAGTYDSDWSGCSNYGNWQSLGSFEIEHSFEARMYYSGYSGSCSYPRLRLVTPSSSYYPNSSGSSGGSPITIEVNSPATGEWSAQGWSDETISYDLNYYYRKIDIMKPAANSFIDYEEWTEELDQLGMFSFNGSVTQNQTLLSATTENKETIKDEINGLSAGGSTAIGDALWEGRNELLSSRGNPEAMKFEILLSDGKSNTGSNPIDRAEQIADDGIVVYTVGLGEDADETILQEIADLTGGEYYYAEDEDVLLEVYEQIALEIGAILEEDQDKAYDANVKLELPAGAQAVDLSSGTLLEEGDANYVSFDIGYLDDENPWEDYFVITYNCNLDCACSQSQLTFPGENSYFQYENESGETQTPIQWSEQKTIQFKYRDLKIEIVNGEILGGKLFLDLNASNIGLLSSNPTNIRLYLDDAETGELLDSVGVNSLNAGEFQLFYDQTLDEEGLIVAVINQGEEISECPQHNISRIRCYKGEKTQFYALKLWVWRK